MEGSVEHSMSCFLDCIVKVTQLTQNGVKQDMNNS